MTEDKARKLAQALDGEVETTMPQSRMAGVRLTLLDGKVAMIDEHGGETFLSQTDMEAYFADGDDAAHIVDTQEWTDWDGSEHWARSLSVLLGSPEYWHSGGGIWVVLFTRADGRFAVIGAEGVDIYQSKDHWERYFESGQPEPEYLSWV